MTILLRQKPLARVVMGIVNASNGAWFDPSDLSTLYQDAAGTIPVTAVEQPVGLMLDKSRGMMLGGAYYTTGLDVGTAGYSIYDTPNNSWTIYRDGVGSGGVDSNTLVPANTFVLVNFYFTRPVAGSSFAISIKTVDGTQYLNLNPSSGYYSVLIKTGVTASKIQFRLPNTGYYAGYSSVSVRELYGYHATQSITASRPTLSARKNLLVATDILSTQSVTTLAAKYCLSFWGTGSITLSGTSTGVLQGTSSDNRVWIEFTPTAGTLTLTVSGAVNKAQLELTS